MLQFFTPLRTFISSECGLSSESHNKQDFQELFLCCFCATMWTHWSCSDFVAAILGRHMSRVFVWRRKRAWEFICKQRPFRWPCISCTWRLKQTAEESTS